LLLLVVTFEAGFVGARRRQEGGENTHRRGESSRSWAPGRGCKSEVEGDRIR
jgi:hypothetical protein